MCRDERMMRDLLTPTYRLFGGSGNPWDAWLVLQWLKDTGAAHGAARGKCPAGSQVPEEAR